MKTVTVEKLGAVIEAFGGAQPVTMKTRTVVDLLKTGNPFSEIVKYSHVNGMIGANYGKSVNRQQVREGADEGTFEPQPPKWGHRIGKKLLAHTPKGETVQKLYVPIHIGKVITPPTYKEVATGAALTKAQFAQWEKDKTSSAEAQGVDREIVYRPYTLSNILEMTIGGETYVVAPSPDVEPLRREIPAEEVAEAIAV